MAVFELHYRWLNDHLRRVGILLVTLVAFTYCGAPASAQLNPAQAAIEMGRGINLGNTLEPPTEGGWNNPPAEEWIFDSYKEAGFSTIRIPVRWDQHTGSTSPYTINEAWMTRVEQVLDWSLDRGMITIVNAHHEDWIKQNYADPDMRARFDSIWAQVSRRFSSKSDRLLFEMINEPRGLTQTEIDELNARVLGIIRETNPTRIVIYSGNEWSNSEQLVAAKIPQDPYIMGYYHSYNPWEFAGLANGTWGSASQVNALRSQVLSVQAWSTNNQVHSMNSEFGAVHAADFNSRMRYYQEYVEVLIEARMPFMAWDDGGDFRVLNRSNRTWGDEKDILMHAWPDGPTGFTIEQVGDHHVKLDWQNRTLQNAIIAQRASFPNGQWSAVDTLSSNESTFTDTTATAGASWKYRLIATNVLQGDRYVHPLKIELPATSRSPFLGSANVIPGTIEAEHFDVGGEGLTYHDSDVENIPSDYRTSESVDVEARTDGGYHVGYVETGEWLEYTVDVQESGRYEVALDVASLMGGGSIHVRIGDALTNRLVIPATNSWQTTTAISQELDLVAGPQVMRLTITGTPAFNVDRVRISRVSGVDTEHPTLPATLAVYPNPAHDYIVLDGSGAPMTADVFNIQGRRLATVRLDSDRTRLDVSHLAPGLYVIRTMTDSSSSTTSTATYPILIRP